MLRAWTEQMRIVGISLTEDDAEEAITQCTQWFNLQRHLDRFDGIGITEAEVDYAEMIKTSPASFLKMAKGIRK